MNNKKPPRWINEIPKSIIIGKREPTQEEKIDAEQFEKAVKDGKVDEWFNGNYK